MSKYLHLSVTSHYCQPPSPLCHILSQKCSPPPPPKCVTSFMNAPFEDCAAWFLWAHFDSDVINIIVFSQWKVKKKWQKKNFENLTPKNSWCRGWVGWVTPLCRAYRLSHSNQASHTDFRRRDLSPSFI